MKKYIKCDNDISDFDRRLFGEEFERIQLARETTSEDIMYTLMNDPSRRVRLCLAYNSNLPLEIIDILQDDDEVIPALLGNTSLNTSQLCCLMDKLLQQYNGKVNKIPYTAAINIVKNPNIPWEYVSKFIKYRDQDIRYTIVYRDDIPFNVLLDYTDDKSNAVSNNARYRIIEKLKQRPDIIKILS